MRKGTILRKCLNTYVPHCTDLSSAVQYEDIWKKQFSGVPYRGLKWAWENNIVLWILQVEKWE